MPDYFYVKVKRPTFARYRFLGSGGHITNLRVHAIEFCGRDRAEEMAAQILKRNPGVLVKVEAVPHAAKSAVLPDVKNDAVPVGSMWEVPDRACYGPFRLVVSVNAAGMAWCATWQDGRWTLKDLISHTLESFAEYRRLTEVKDGTEEAAGVREVRQPDAEAGEGATGGRFDRRAEGIEAEARNA